MVFQKPRFSAHVFHDRRGITVRAGEIGSCALVPPSCGTGLPDFQCERPPPPRKAKQVFAPFCREGIPDGTRIALVTDQSPIAHARPHNSGFGEIGKGCPLNKPHVFTYDLRFQHGINATRFYVDGPCNPTKAPSASFGEK